MTQQGWNSSELQTAIQREGRRREWGFPSAMEEKGAPGLEGAQVNIHTLEVNVECTDWGRDGARKYS